MKYKMLPDTVVIDGIKITSSYDKTPMRDTTHYDTKEKDNRAVPLCGLGNVYSWYTTDLEEVNCKKCLKKYKKLFGDKDG